MRTLRVTVAAAAAAADDAADDNKTAAVREPGQACPSSYLFV